MGRLTRHMNGVIATYAQTIPICSRSVHHPICYPKPFGGKGCELTLALCTISSSTAGGNCCSVAKSRRGDELPIPEVLLKTVVMMVRANVPPNGSATAIRDMTVATWFGKKPIPWSEPVGVQIASVRTGVVIRIGDLSCLVPGINLNPVPAPVMAIIPKMVARLSLHRA